MNVRFKYLYRDAGNYKNWGEIVFSNPQDADITAISSKAKKVLIDQTYFVARKATIPNLYFSEYDDELDHTWHEVHAFDETADLPTDFLGRNIEEFIDSLRSASKP